MGLAQSEHTFYQQKIRGQLVIDPGAFEILGQFSEPKPKLNTADPNPN